MPQCLPGLFSISRLSLRGRIAAAFVYFISLPRSRKDRIVPHSDFSPRVTWSMCPRRIFRGTRCGTGGGAATLTTADSLGCRANAAIHEPFRDSSLIPSIIHRTRKFRAGAYPIRMSEYEKAKKAPGLLEAAQLSLPGGARPSPAGVAGDSRGGPIREIRVEILQMTGAESNRWDGFAIP